MRIAVVVLPRDGAPVTPDAVRRAFDTAARRAKLEQVTPHTCRHGPGLPTRCREVRLYPAVAPFRVLRG